MFKPILLLSLLVSTWAQRNYIVTFKPGTVSVDDRRLLQSTNALDSFKVGDVSGIIVDEVGAEELRGVDFVNSIDPDETIQIDIPEIVTQAFSWGIDRIDQINLPLDNSYTPPNDGSGTYVYVLDTGCRITHTEFNNDRVEHGESQFSSPDDRHGHGTHVMSTAIGRTVGVAPGAKGVSVKVLSDSGSGSYSGVIKGLEWSVNDIKTKGRCGVISMSLGGGRNTALNDVVNAAVKDGINVIVAAGNSNQDACNFSPASAEMAITVGSTTSTDARSSFSNVGSCVDIFAPGSSINGAGISSNNAYRTLSGTSMACPHVSGAFSLLFKSNQCDQVNAERDIEALGLDDQISSVPSSTPNIFLQVQEIVSEPTTSPTPAPTTPPTTPNPTTSPTLRPTREPPTPRPTREPRTSRPTRTPTPRPTRAPQTPRPTRAPRTPRPTRAPTPRPTRAPQTPRPTRAPRTPRPTRAPTPRPTSTPPPTDRSIPPVTSPVSCEEECAEIRQRCRCWYNNYVMNNECRCRWKKGNKPRCIVQTEENTNPNRIP